MRTREWLIKLALAAVLVATVAVGMIWSGAALAALLEDFSSDSIDHNLWQYSTYGGTELEQTGGALVFTHPSTIHADFGANFNARCALTGDFDIQVDFDLVTWPADNGVRFAVGDNQYVVGRSSLATFEFPGAPRENYYSQLAGVVKQVNAPDNSGRLRLTRVGQTITAYFYNPQSGDWVEIDHSTGAPTGNFSPSIVSFSGNSQFGHQTTVLAADNFMVNGARTCYRNGDLDCNGIVDGRDALVEAIHESGAAQVDREDGCPDIGSSLTQPAGIITGPTTFGDVNCDGDANTDDLMQLLKHIAGLETTQPDTCTQIGEYIRLSDS